MSETVVPQPFRMIAAGVYLEGLAIDYRRNVIWYSDVIAGGIHGVTPEGEPVASFDRERMWTGGVMLNEDGSVLSTGEGGIRWNNPESGKSGWLLERIDGEPINGINEMVSDGTGGIFFGTIDMERVIKGQATRPCAIYRLTASGDVIKLTDMHFPNGVMFDPVRRRFYCNDTFACTWAFDVTAALTLENKHKFLDKEDVDGMALDAEGNVWISGFRSSCLTRLRHDGTQLPQLQVGTGSITQVRFGGPDMRDLYCNSVPADGGDSLKDGVPLTAKNSFLFRGRSEVPGMPLQPSRFRLE